MRRFPGPLLALLAGVAVLACGPEAPPEEATGHPVSLSAVEAVDLADRIEATGQLLAKERAEIAAEVGGRITEVLIDEGRGVEVGTAVLAIDPERRSLERDSAKARVDETRAATREQKRELARISELRERGVASQTQLDSVTTALALARSRHDAAAAQLGVAERALADAQVTAPFAGLIARRMVSRGEYVAVGQKLFELVSLNPIEVEFHLAEKDSGRVAVGQSVSVRVAPYPDVAFPATVTVVSPTIESRTRTLRVKAQLDNVEGRLRPGLFARVDLGIQVRRGVPMIPEEAVLQRADGAVVFRLLEGNRVSRQLVETGEYRDGRVEVVKGLTPGDIIVSRGQSTLVDGQEVVPREPDGSLVSSPISEMAVSAEGSDRAEATP